MPKGPNSRPTNREILKLAGILVHRSAVTEACMFMAFKIISGCPQKIAQTIFYTLDTLQGKKSLLNRIASAVGDKQDQALVKEFIKAAEKSSNQRRDLAHSLITSENVKGIKVHKLYHPKTKRHEEVSREMVETYLRISSEAFDEAERALEELARKHGVPAELDLE